MVVFVNDIKVRIDHLQKSVAVHKFDKVVYNATTLEIPLLKGSLMLVNPRMSLIQALLESIVAGQAGKLTKVTLLMSDKGAASKMFKRKFAIVQAGGGIPEKDGKLLMILRQGKWDFPKGKLEKGEEISECALREVEEECNIQVELEEKIGVTWHTYIRNNKRILKKNHWYRMTCLDDAEMAPQLEEGIEKTVWMTPQEAEACMGRAFPSIAHLYKKYKKHKSKLLDTGRSQAVQVATLDKPDTQSW